MAPVDLDSRIALLQGVPTLRAYPRDDLARLAALVEEDELQAGDVLVSEGNPTSESFVIVDGTVTATRRGERVATLGAGQFIGEMVMFDRASQPTTITAQSRLHVLVVSQDAVAAFLGPSPAPHVP